MIIFEENFMQKRLYQFLMLLTVVALVIASTSTVYADDGTTDGTMEQATSETQPVEETVEEIIEQVPEGTEVVVVSDEGVEPLATEAAAETILESDPIWCPTGQVPGDAGCTAPQATVTDLIANLGSATGAGTIYFTSIYSTNDATFDHTNANLANLTDLTIQGGWNGVSGVGYALSGITTFSGVPLAIRHWTGNVTLNDLVIDGEDVDTGVYVETGGDIVLYNTSANNNGFDGADLINYEGTGNVTVNGGTFLGNDNTGLYIASQGTVNVNNAAANDNRDGVIIDNSYGTGNANITIGVFDDNIW